jgi:hypothetical protein
MQHCRSLYLFLSLSLSRSLSLPLPFSLRHTQPCKNVYGLACYRCQMEIVRHSTTQSSLRAAQEELADRTAALASANAQIDALNVSARMTEQRTATLQAERQTMTESMAVRLHSLVVIGALVHALLCFLDALYCDFRLSME